MTRPPSPNNLIVPPPAGASAGAGGIAPDGTLPPPDPSEGGEGPSVRRAKHVQFLATLRQPKQPLPPEPDDAIAAPADEDVLLVSATLPQRLVAGAIDVFVVLVAAPFGGLLLTYLVWGALLDTDFDGARQHKAMGDWLFLANGLALAVLYSAVEAFGRPTAGDKALGLRLVPAPPAPGSPPPVPAAGPHAEPPPSLGAPPDPPRAALGWRLRLRWALANLPLIVMTLLCSAGALHTHTLGYEAFETAGRRPDRHLALIAVLLPLYWLAGYLWAWAHDGQTFWDRLAGVELRRQAAPSETSDRQRGFEVVTPRSAAHAGPQ